MTATQNKLLANVNTTLRRIYETNVLPKVLSNLLPRIRAAELFAIELRRWWNETRVGGHDQNIRGEIYRISSCSAKTLAERVDTLHRSLGLDWPSLYKGRLHNEIIKCFKDYAPAWIAGNHSKDSVNSALNNVNWSALNGHTVALTTAQVDYFGDLTRTIEWDEAGFPHAYGQLRKKIRPAPGSKFAAKSTVDLDTLEKRVSNAEVALTTLASRVSKVEHAIAVADLKGKLTRANAPQEAKPAFRTMRSLKVIRS